MGLWQSTKAFVASVRLRTSFDRSSIIQDLGRSHDAASYSDMLIDVLLHDKKHSLNAAESLGWLSSEKAVEPLAQTLRSSTDDCTQRVCRGIATNKFAKAVDVAVERVLHDPSEKVRLTCIRILGNVGNKETATSVLLEILAKEKSTDVTRQAIAILGKVSDASVVPMLDEIMLTHEKEPVREAAFYALRTLSPDTTIEHLIGKLRDKENVSEEKKYLISMGKDAVAPLIAEIERGSTKDANIKLALGEIAAPDAAPLLIGAITHENQTVRWNAAKALGNMPESPEIFNALSRAALHDNNAFAVSALKKKYFTNAASRFLELIDNPANAPKDRVRAIDIVVTLEHAKNPEIIANALGDADYNVRRSAAMAMEKMGTTEQVPLLIQRLGEESSAAVRSHIIRSLGIIKDDRATEPLIALLRDHKSNDYLGAVEALGKIGNKSAVPYIITVADMPSSSEFSVSTLLERSSIEALALLQDSRSIPTLNNALESPDRWTRAHAAKGLCTMGNEKTVPALLAKLGDIYEDVRLNVVEAIGKQQAAHQAIDILVSMIIHDADVIKKAAAEALASSGGEAAIIPLFQAAPKAPSFLYYDIMHHVNPATYALSSIINTLDFATAPAGLASEIIPFISKDYEKTLSYAIKAAHILGDTSHILPLTKIQGKGPPHYYEVQQALRAICKRSDLSELIDVQTIPTLISCLEAPPADNKKIKDTLSRLYGSKEQLREAILMHPTMADEEKIHVWNRWDLYAQNDAIEATQNMIANLTGIKIRTTTTPFDRRLGDIDAECNRIKMAHLHAPTPLSEAAARIVNHQSLLRGANKVDPKAAEELVRAAMPTESITDPAELMRPSASALTSEAQARLDAERARLTNLSQVGSDNGNGKPVEFFDVSKNSAAQSPNPGPSGSIDLSSYAAALTQDGSPIYAGGGGAKKPHVRT